MKIGEDKNYIRHDERNVYKFDETISFVPAY